MKLLIAITNNDERRMLEYSFRFDSNTMVVGSFNNGNEALDACFQHKPEVMVLDMLLEGTDGIGVLEQIKKSNLKTKVIMLTSIKSENAMEKAFDAGADYIMVRPYDFAALKRRIKDLTGVGEVVDENPPVAAASDNYVERKISAILNGTGIMPNLKGYRYLKTALLKGYKDDEILDGITKVLYPTIAKEYNTSTARVERAIRHAIETAWNKCGNNDFYKEIGFVAYENSKRPTNGEFVFTVIEYLRNTVV
jgi:two-component system response regulator (stage 0 sporulation protein A)